MSVMLSSCDVASIIHPALAHVAISGDRAVVGAPGQGGAGRPYETQVESA